jgi:acyl carrier protein
LTVEKNSQAAFVARIAMQKLGKEMTSDLGPERVESLVREFLAERFDIPQGKMTTDVGLRELGLDSIMMLDVMLEVEDRLGIKLHDLSMPANPKIQDIVELIQRNLASKS